MGFEKEVIVLYGRTAGRKIKQYSLLLLPFLGIVMIGAMLALVWFWNQMGREMFYYTEVVVLEEDIKRGTVIQSDMIHTLSVEKDQVIDQSITHSSAIIGMAAKHFIPAHSQLHPYYFVENELAQDEDHFVFHVPTDWIYSIPQSLRRLDHVFFYEVTGTKPQMQKSDEEQTEEDASDPSFNTHELQKETEWKQTLGQPLLETTVAYVKDSANREVKTLSETPRLDGSSRVSEIEVVATIEEIQTLELAVQEGSRFIIMYDEGGKTS